jgi:GT2 family glycosyltransferase
MVNSNLLILTDNFANIYIIDNASLENKSAEIKKSFPEVKYIRLDRNYGWAGGYNRALDKISRDGYSSAFILNSDAIVNAESVRSAVNGLGPRVAAVGSIILEDEGNIIAYDGNFNIARKPISLDNVDPNRLPVRSVHGAAFAMNIDAYRDIGPFYEPYFLYHEETDWCSEAKKKGYEIFVDGKSHCLHVGAASSSNENQEYYLTRNNFIALKRGNDLVGVPNTWLGFVFQGLKSPKNNRRLTSARLDGLLDGVLGRFGKRQSKWNPVTRTIMVLALKIFIIPTGAAIKLIVLLKSFIRNFSSHDQ